MFYFPFFLCLKFLCLSLKLQNYFQVSTTLNLKL
jgi:hypothetical protein